MPAVEKLLGDDYVPVRFAAALAVGDMKYYPAKNKVRRLLVAPDENTKVAAAYAMSKLDPASKIYFEVIKKTVRSKDQTVRANAIVLLGKSGDRSVLEVLYRALKASDSGSKVRFQTVEALARLGDEEVFGKLWAMVLSTYADDRIMGIKAMGALATPKAKEVLITKLDDELLEVRLAAAEQLGILGETIGEAEVLDVFGKRLRNGLRGEDLERINVFTALAIGEICTPSVRKFLPQLLGNESKTVRIAAAKGVFGCLMRE
jgi:HEAT repeat protein